MPQTVPVPLDIASDRISLVLNAEFSGTFINEIRNPARPKP